MRGAFVPGKLQAYLDAQYAPLSDVVQASVVRHADQLVSHDPSNSSSRTKHSHINGNLIIGVTEELKTHECYARPPALVGLQEVGGGYVPRRTGVLTGCRGLSCHVWRTRDSGVLGAAFKPW